MIGEPPMSTVVGIGDDRSPRVQAALGLLPQCPPDRRPAAFLVSTACGIELIGLNRVAFGALVGQYADRRTQTEGEPSEMAEEHAKQLSAARDKLVTERRQLAEILAKPTSAASPT
jgi:hypothetical protein